MSSTQFAAYQSINAANKNTKQDLMKKLQLQTNQHQNNITNKENI